MGAEFSFWLHAMAGQCAHSPQALAPAVVASPALSLAELAALMGTALRRAGWKEMRCGQAVLDALERELPAAEPLLGGYGAPVGDPLVMLLGMSMVHDEVLDPAGYRIIHHTACVVEGTEVSHQLCPVVDAGVLEPKATP